ncbi:hypothetical protein RUM44_005816 [Polyplax serrata]|uniref:Ubiquitin-associated protein 1 n=1 Tax=Polyplax serrata TaxID=468196 RepID=A0ABR1AYS0_POLSC
MLQHCIKNEKLQPNTFIDGVNVKISEQYKPPRRVILPVSCQNCSFGEALYKQYDFRLEQNVLNKLAEWKTLRREQFESRKERLTNEAKVCEEHYNCISVNSAKNEGSQQCHQQLNSNLTDSVLTPVCAKQISPSHKPVASNFNLSDFESDNSSPFDNMELKTINDMEVLATILSTNNMEQSIHNNNNIIDKDIGKNCLVLKNRNNEWGHTPINGYNNMTYSNVDCGQSVAAPQYKDFNQFGFYPIRDHMQISNYGLNDFSNQCGAAVSLDQAATVFNRQDPTLGKIKDSAGNASAVDGENSKCVPDIMLELEQELRENREREEEMEKRNKLIYLKESILSSNFKDHKGLPESSRRVQDGSALSKLPDPTCSLSPSTQKLICYISEMGFPLARVARACEMFQNNDKKIIEFLLQVQILEEKQYPGDLIEKALALNKFQLSDAVRYLEAMIVLLDLGFDEKHAEEALMATNNDRDKALDMLIS